MLCRGFSFVSWTKAAVSTSLRTDASALATAAAKADPRLEVLLPKVAYLYGVVLQALVLAAHTEDAAGPARSWYLQQQHHVLHFCAQIREAMENLGQEKFIFCVSLTSLSQMLNACNCLLRALSSGWKVSPYKQQQALLVGLLEQTEAKIAAFMQKQLLQGCREAPKANVLPTDMFVALVALARSSSSIEFGSEEAATKSGFLSPAVRNIAKQLYLSETKLIRWLSEAEADEKLLLQQRKLQ